VSKTFEMKLQITSCIRSKVPQEDAAPYLSEAVLLRTSILALAHQGRVALSPLETRPSGALFFQIGFESPDRCHHSSA
jgi:hypothetical protein